MKWILPTCPFLRLRSPGNPPARIVFLLWCWAALVPAMSGAAPESATGQFRVAMAQGREVVVLPSAGAAGRRASQWGPISASSYETRSQRVHVVQFEGKTFRAVTPLEGPSSRIVFDPSRRRFVRLLSSIRVELQTRSQAELVARLTGATRVAFLDKLGFAIADLPDSVHPLDAIARLESAPAALKATIRLRRPPIEWR